MSHKLKPRQVQKRATENVDDRATVERQQKGRYDHFKMVHYDPDTAIPEPSVKAAKTSFSIAAGREKTKRGKQGELKK